MSPNIEKIFNDDNTLKANYNNQVTLAVQNNIYNMNEINESGIEPFPMDTTDIIELNTLQKNSVANPSGAPVPNRRLKAGNCECCSVM